MLPVPVLGTQGQIWLHWEWQEGNVAAPVLATCRVAASRRLWTGSLGVQDEAAHCVLAVFGAVAALAVVVLGRSPKLWQGACALAPAHARPQGSMLQRLGACQSITSAARAGCPGGEPSTDVAAFG